VYSTRDAALMQARVQANMLHTIPRPTIGASTGRWTMSASSGSGAVLLAKPGSVPLNPVDLGIDDEDVEQPDQPGAPQDRAADGALRVARLAAQRAGALEPDEGEDGEDHAHRDPAQAAVP
jgi:hypothetical protein